MSLITDLGQVAGTLLVLGELGKAASLAEDILDVGRSHGLRAPDHPETRYSNALALETKAEIERARGELQSAREGFRAAADILELLSREKDSMKYRYWLVRALRSLGEIELRAGERERAAATFDRGLSVARELVAILPSPEHLDTLVKMLLLAQREEEAAPIIDRLAAMGYQSRPYLDFLARHGMG